MRPYKSKSGKSSGVTGYISGKDHIIVQFNYSSNYKYSYKSAGRDVVETMKKLASAMQGLSTYISQHNPGYE
jgi:hypothetical protein